MKQIYLDREQCYDFNVPYYEEGKISLPADAILRSKKSSGYDQAHQDFLRPIGNRIIHLSKKYSDAPGWYTIGSR
jgi:hypothetical protein